MKYLIGFVAGAALSMFAVGEIVLQSQDELARVKEQYAGCSNIGSLPTNADMLSGESNQ